VSRTRRRSHREEPEVEVWTASPVTGALGITGQSPETARFAGSYTPLGMSRQVRAYVISCEERDCPWRSAEEPSPGACELRLLAHARAEHPGARADRVDVRVRSGKHAFRIEAIER
jgi:hypothetical protein